MDYIRLLAGEPGAARIPAVAVRFIDQTFVYLNPCNGNVLGQRHRYGGLLGTIEQVHRLRFMPNGSWTSKPHRILLYAAPAPMAAGTWVGKVLAEDPQLRQSLNDHLESAARSAAPEFAEFLTKHIADTVRNWDSKEMSEQIELNIGKDLQFIRINGTLVGGLIGIVLYLVSPLPRLFGAASLPGF